MSSSCQSKRILTQMPWPEQERSTNRSGSEVDLTKLLDDILFAQEPPSF